VVGEGARYFSSAQELDRLVTHLLTHPEHLQDMRAKSSARFQSEFTWDRILDQYERLLTRFLPEPRSYLGAARSAKHIL
jgi:glycosyltransferase involved in cell wall biosynthesis